MELVFRLPIFSLPFLTVPCLLPPLPVLSRRLSHAKGGGAMRCGGGDGSPVGRTGLRGGWG
jgi:hypothetical protein